MNQTNLIAALTQRVRDSHAETKRSLDGWTSCAARGALPNDPELEALRAEWQRARDEYLEVLEMYFSVASGALANAEDNESRLAATAKAVAFLRRAG